MSYPFATLGPVVVADTGLIDAFRISLRPVDPAATGLYFATCDSGGRAALRFWQRATAVGVGVASPQGFAETLASERATRLCIALGITGPVHVLCGGPDASTGAIDAARWDLEDGAVQHALVVRCDDADLASCVLVAALLLDTGGLPETGLSAGALRDPIHELCRRAASTPALEGNQHA